MKIVIAWMNIYFYVITLLYKPPIKKNPMYGLMCEILGTSKSKAKQDAASKALLGEYNLRMEVSNVSKY